MADLTDRLQAALGSAYRIDRELGGGGMSHVFVAEEVALGRRVVVKVLPPEMGAGLNAERFRREIQLAASLQHPHVVPLHAAGRTEDLVWYTMPLIEGESLRAKMAREGELPVTETVRILRDVADSLAYAHAQGVVHRDIKPDNVLLSGRHAVVTDFGVAKALSDATGQSSLTSVGIALGTPSYMAPEQAAADPHVDHRADIYALGAMAYEMLTGKPPFGGAPQMVLAAHVTQTPEPVTARRASVPPALAQLVMRCLEKKAADRYQTATELHQALELMATPSGGMEPTSATEAVPGTRASVAAGGRMGRLLPWFAAAVIVIAVSVFALTRGRTPEGSLALDPNVVAVLPFRVVGADPSLHFLRQGMMDLLHAKLTGVGGPRAADVQSVVAAVRDQVGDDGDVAGDALTAVVRRVGAGLVLQGSIVGPAEGFVLTASLVEMPSGRTVAQTSVEGSKDRIFALVDLLSQRLLALGAGASESQLEALTTANFDALRAYLDGQAAYRRGAFQESMVALERASSLDSTFALAHSAAIETASWWSTATVDMDNVRRLAWKYRERLHATDQRLLSIRLGSRWPEPTPYTVEIEDREALVRLLPESPTAWYYLGDAYFHGGRLAAASDPFDRARNAFEEAVRRDSSFAAPLEHLAKLHQLAGDTANFRRFALRRLALDSSAVSGALIKADLAFLTGNATAQRRALGELADLGGGVQTWIRLSATSPHVIAAADTALAERSRRTIPVDERIGLGFDRVALRLEQGRPTEARRLTDSLLALLPRDPARDLDLFIRAALFTEADTAGIGQRRAQRDPAQQTFLEVVLWDLRTGDLAAAERGIAQYRIRASVTVPGDEPRALENRASAGRYLMLLEAAIAQIRGAPDVARLVARADSAVAGWLDRADINALVLSGIYEAMGDDASALRTLQRQHLDLAQPPLPGVAARLRTEGRLAARLGQPERAIKAYRTYLMWRADPEPSLVPQRDSVRAELAKLTGER